MTDQDTPLYHTGSATFELPSMLKDKTMHVFTLTDDGPSDFSVVISHADPQAEEELEDFSERLTAELSRSLPKFELKGRVELMLDGVPAIELAYSWRNEGHFMHQRQVIAMVAGLGAGSTRAMLIAATCLKPFSEEWNTRFDTMLASMRLRKDTPQHVEEPATDRFVAATEPGYVFVLSERRRTLRVFANDEEACSNTDPREVEQNGWTFFDARGHRIHPRFVVPNTGTLWKKAGSYVLEPRVDLPAEELRDCLHRAAILQRGDGPFASIADVREFLNRQTTD